MVVLLNGHAQEAATVRLDVHDEARDVARSLSLWEGDEVSTSKQGLEGDNIGCCEGGASLCRLHDWSEGYGHGLVCLVWAVRLLVVLPSGNVRLMPLHFRWSKSLEINEPREVEESGNHLVAATSRCRGWIAENRAKSS